MRELKEHVTSDGRATGGRRGRPRNGERAKAVTAVRKVVRLLEEATDAVEKADLQRRDRGELETLVERLATAELQLTLMNRIPRLSELSPSTAAERTEAETLKCAG